MVARQPVRVDNEQQYLLPKRSEAPETMKQILLLEDLPEIRAWLKTLALQVFPGAQISESARIHDALELVNAVRFDVAMVDLGLPDGSGVEVVQALREKQPDVQSVVVTIHDDDDHLFPALQAGAFGDRFPRTPFEGQPAQDLRLALLGASPTASSRAALSETPPNWTMKASDQR